MLNNHQSPTLSLLKKVRGQSDGSKSNSFKILPTALDSHFINSILRGEGVDVNVLIDPSHYSFLPKDEQTLLKALLKQEFANNLDSNKFLEKLKISAASEGGKINYLPYQVNGKKIALTDPMVRFGKDIFKIGRQIGAGSDGNKVCLLQLIARIEEGKFGSKLQFISEEKSANKKNTQYVIKIHPIELNKSDKEIKYANLECKLINQVNEENAQTCFLGSDVISIKSEKAEGLSLIQYLRDTPNLDLDEKLFLLNGALDAIMKVHEKSVAHFDFTVSNIFFDPVKSQFKVIDFGSSIDMKASEEELNRIDWLREHITTPYFQPFEKAERANKKKRLMEFNDLSKVDCYSFAATSGLILTYWGKIQPEVTWLSAPVMGKKHRLTHNGTRMSCLESLDEKDMVDDTTSITDKLSARAFDFSALKNDNVIYQNEEDKKVMDLLIAEIAKIGEEDVALRGNFQGLHQLMEKYTDRIGEGKKKILEREKSKKPKEVVINEEEINISITTSVKAIAASIKSITNIPISIEDIATSTKDTAKNWVGIPSDQIESILRVPNVLNILPNGYLKNHLKKMLVIHASNINLSYSINIKAIIEDLLLDILAEIKKYSATKNKSKSASWTVGVKYSEKEEEQPECIAKLKSVINDLSHSKLDKILEDSPSFKQAIDVQAKFKHKSYVVSPGSSSSFFSLSRSTEYRISESEFPVLDVKSKTCTI